MLKDTLETTTLLSAPSYGADSDSSNDDKDLRVRRDLTLPHLIAIGIGGCIGSGIFVSPVGIMQRVGSIGASLVLWLVCGICQMMFGLCYGELAGRIPISGGDYVYFRVAFGEFMACIRLWLSVLTTPLEQGVYILLTVEYITRPLYPDCPLPAYLKGLAYLIILGMVSTVNTYNVQFNGRVQIVFTVAKLLALTAVIALGLERAIIAGWGQLEEPFAETNYSISSFVMAFYSGAWALGGWATLYSIVGEMKNPHRDLPVSLMISIFTVTAIYILANIAYACVLDRNEMLTKPAVAEAFAAHTMGSVTWMMSLAISIAVLGSSKIAMLGTSRMWQVGAKYGHLPEPLSLISIKERTPLPTIVIMTAICVAGLFFDDIFYLIEVAGFVWIEMHAVAIIALLKVRCKDLNPGGVLVKAPFLVPELTLVITCILIINTCIQRPLESILSIVAQFTIAPIVYIACVKWKNKPPEYFELKAGVTNLVQKILQVLPEDESDDQNNSIQHLCKLLRQR